jgi:hypothetical protein
MILKLRKALALQQSPRHASYVSRLLFQRNCVLYLTEEHQQLDPLLWASMKVEKFLKEIQINKFCIFHIRPVNLFHILHLGSKGIRGKGLLHTEGCKEEEALETLIMSIVKIDWLS